MPKKSAANRGTSLEAPKKNEDIELDPILPLPAIGKYPGVKQGEGAEVLANTKLMVVEMPYRVFYSLFEHVERRAAVQYPKYKDRKDDMIDYAHAQVEAVAAFRSAFLGEVIPILSEADAQKIREAKTKKVKKKVVQADEPVQDDCPKCGPNQTVLKKKRNGKKIWKCQSCGHRWPRSTANIERTSPVLASRSRSNGLKDGSGSPSAANSSEGASRPRKRPAKTG